MTELDIENGTVTLAMGGGGAETDALIGGIFRKHLGGPLMTADDAAVLPPAESAKGRLCMTTDGFIVSPWCFPGGNVGKLSVCGTVNDLACMGAKPLYLTCAVVAEEGFPLKSLDIIAASMEEMAKEAGVQFVAGDTKVAGKGQVDGVFITTTGAGLVEGASPAGNRAQAGDVVIVTGDVGRHGAAILTARGNLGIEAEGLVSDCAPLNHDVLAVLKAAPNTHVIRDATRGGMGTVLYEIARQSNVGIEIDRQNIPVMPSVSGVCSMLGLEVLYLACEGTMAVFVPEAEAGAALDALHGGRHTSGAKVIGRVVDERKGHVVVNTQIGSRTMLPPPGGELLPRIC